MRLMFGMLNRPDDLVGMSPDIRDRIAPSLDDPDTGNGKYSYPMWRSSRSGASIAPFGVIPINEVTQGTDQDDRGFFTDGPAYGNWCGGRWSGGRFSPPGRPMGSGEPIDSMDEACRTHDFCYDQAGTSSGMMKACDRNLVRDLQNLPTFQSDWPRSPPGSGVAAELYRRGMTGYFRSKNSMVPDVNMMPAGDPLAGLRR